MSHYNLERDLKLAEHMWQDALVNLYMAVREHLPEGRNLHKIQTQCEQVEAMEREVTAAKQALHKAQQEAA